MYQAPRGTTDILPDDQAEWAEVRSVLDRTAANHGYQRIDTPIFENTDVFARTVGDDTDIVEKEMYNFRDRGNQQLTLRPEGTAAVCRAYLEHGLQNTPQPVRLYYVGPMFRYDRPQAGRYRLFHQLGAEAIGDPSPTVDLEIIQFARTMIDRLGLRETVLTINSIGDPADRASYLDALATYYKPKLAELCGDCNRRYTRNPLRLLDCKQVTCQTHQANAPTTINYLGTDAGSHWEELLAHLDSVGISYTIDPRLVRGLDYYTRTVFELHPSIGSSQSALCAGGRYDGLIAQLGGPPTAGIGFAAGIERIILNRRNQGSSVPKSDSGLSVLAYNGAEGKTRAIILASELRAVGIPIILAPERSLRAQMRYGSGIGAQRVLILGSNELAQGTISIRDMATSQQIEVPLEHIRSAMQE